MAVNSIDIFLVLLILLSVWAGWRHGLLLGLLNLSRWLGSLVAGWLLYPTVARLLALENGLPEMWRAPLGFLLVVLITGVLLRLFGNALLGRLPRDFHERPFNRVLGALPGLINGLVVAAIVTAFLFVVPLPGLLREDTRESWMADRLTAIAEQLTTALTPIFEDILAHGLKHRVPVYPQADERVSLPFKAENPRPRPELEANMLGLVNRERTAATLPPLKLDRALTEAARSHSADMLARSYFSHYTPEGRSPFDRMRESRVRFLIAGENIALAPTVRIAHTGLMNSPGHRANILRPQFGRVGIGIMDGGLHGLMVTQNFRN
jgi:uncharacterized protein YkwD